MTVSDQDKAKIPRERKRDRSNDGDLCACVRVRVCVWAVSVCMVCVYDLYLLPTIPDADFHIPIVSIIPTIFICIHTYPTYLTYLIYTSFCIKTVYSLPYHEPGKGSPYGVPCI